MSNGTVTIDLINKTVSTTIPYDSANDMAMIIEVAQEAADKHIDNQKKRGETHQVEGQV